jgi:Asp/Glu/hydantoin racemase
MLPMTSAASPRIALIHATPLAIEPVARAFETLWPAAQRTNLLDDSLPADRARDPDVTPAMIERFINLARYVKASGADAILFTCSAFGPAIEAARDAVGLPTLKPNEAMFDTALSTGDRIGLVLTFEPSVAPMRAEMMALATARGRNIDLRIRCQPLAQPALIRGDAALHDQMVAEMTAELADCDVVMLGQFSVARARDLAQQQTRAPVLTSPDSAVKQLKKLLNRS